ncbi:ribonuclease J [Candidatus Microgenomates bacterium]|nr:ribonuclease J [Candidatus Microgenomates bacterium]
MSTVSFISLGGIGDVTKNIYVYETEKDLIVVDCGVGFPDDNMLGVDLVLPDISYLLKNKNKLRGIFITHAHEDHIGALPYLWPKLNCPIFATKFAAYFIENKFHDFSISQKVNIVKDDFVEMGDFKVSYIHVNHSVPDSANLAIETPLGVFYHGSDFKYDWTPLDGRFTELGKITKAADKGILCLLSDCLGSEREGYTLSERVVEEQLTAEIGRCKGKFIVTAHSSDIYRWQMVVNVAKKTRRKIVLLGRSVEQAIDIARRLRYLDLPQEMIIEQKEVKKYPAQTLCLLAAGSQGQPESALTRIANQEHSKVRIENGDSVIFSADPIPGNENMVHGVIDQLTKLGATVSYSEVTDRLHVSGHASQEELYMLMGLTKPKYFIPIGGTFRQMKKYAEMTEKLGYQANKTFLLETGQKVIFDNNSATLGEKIDLDNVLIDGLGVGDVGHIVLRDRQQLSKDGVVVVILPIAVSTGKLSGEMDISSRGFVYMKESEQLIRDAKRVVQKQLEKNNSKVFDWQFLRKKIENALSQFFYRETARRPMVLPIIVEV